MLLQAVTNAAKASRKKICLFMVFFSEWSERVGWTSRRFSDRDGSPTTDRDGPRCGKEAGTAFPTSGQTIRLCGWVSGAGHLIGAAVRRLGSMPRALREGVQGEFSIVFFAGLHRTGGMSRVFLLQDRRSGASGRPNCCRQQSTPTAAAALQKPSRRRRRSSSSLRWLTSPGPW